MLSGAGGLPWGLGNAEPTGSKEQKKVEQINSTKSQKEGDEPDSEFLQLQLRTKGSWHGCSNSQVHGI